MPWKHGGERDDTLYYLKLMTLENWSVFMCVVFSVPANLILRILEAECSGSRLIIGKHWIRSLHPIIRHQISHHITANKRVFCKSGYIHIFLNDFLSLSVHIVDFSVVVVVGNNWRTLDMFSAMF